MLGSARAINRGVQDIPHGWMIHVVFCFGSSADCTWLCVPPVSSSAELVILSFDGRRSWKIERAVQLALSFRKIPHGELQLLKVVQELDKVNSMKQIEAAQITPSECISERTVEQSVECAQCLGFRTLPKGSRSPVLSMW